MVHLAKISRFTYRVVADEAKMGLDTKSTIFNGEWTLVFVERLLPKDENPFAII